MLALSLGSNSPFHALPTARTPVRSQYPSAPEQLNFFGSATSRSTIDDMPAWLSQSVWYTKSKRRTLRPSYPLPPVTNAAWFGNSAGAPLEPSASLLMLGRQGLAGPGGHSVRGRPARLARLRTQAKRLSSRRAITILWTSSGPSAIRSARPNRHMAATGVSSVTPSAPRL